MSCQDGVNVVYDAVNGEREGGHHIKGGKEYEIVGKDTQTCGVGGTSKSTLQGEENGSIKLIILHKATIHNLIDWAIAMIDCY